MNMPDAHIKSAGLIAPSLVSSFYHLYRRDAILILNIQNINPRLESADVNFRKGRALYLLFLQEFSFCAVNFYASRKQIFFRRTTNRKKLFGRIGEYSYCFFEFHVLLFNACGNGNSGGGF